MKLKDFFYFGNALKDVGYCNHVLSPPTSKKSFTYVTYKIVEICSIDILCALYTMRI